MLVKINATFYALLSHGGNGTSTKLIGRQQVSPPKKLYRSGTVSVVMSRDGIACAAPKKLYRSGTVFVVMSREHIACAANHALQPTADELMSTKKPTVPGRG